MSNNKTNGKSDHAPLEIDAVVKNSIKEYLFTGKNFELAMNAEDGETESALKMELDWLVEDLSKKNGLKPELTEKAKRYVSNFMTFLKESTQGNMKEFYHAASDDERTLLVSNIVLEGLERYTQTIKQEFAPSCPDSEVYRVMEKIELPAPATPREESKAKREVPFVSSVRRYTAAAAAALTILVGGSSITCNNNHRDQSTRHTVEISQDAGVRSIAGIDNSPLLDYIVESSKTVSPVKPKTVETKPIDQKELEKQLAPQVEELRKYLVGIFAQAPKATKISYLAGDPKLEGLDNRLQEAYKDIHATWSDKNAGKTGGPTIQDSIDYFYKAAKTTEPKAKGTRLSILAYRIARQDYGINLDGLALAPNRHKELDPRVDFSKKSYEERLAAYKSKNGSAKQPERVAVKTPDRKDRTLNKYRFGNPIPAPKVKHHIPNMPTASVDKNVGRALPRPIDYNAIRMRIPGERSRPEPTPEPRKDVKAPEAKKSLEARLDTTINNTRNVNLDLNLVVGPFMAAGEDLSYSSRIKTYCPDALKTGEAEKKEKCVKALNGAQVILSNVYERLNKMEAEYKQILAQYDPKIRNPTVEQKIDSMYRLTTETQNMLQKVKDLPLPQNIEKTEEDPAKRAYQRFMSGRTVTDVATEMGIARATASKYIISQFADRK